MQIDDVRADEARTAGDEDMRSIQPKPPFYDVRSITRVGCVKGDIRNLLASVRPSTKPAVR